MASDDSARAVSSQRGGEVGHGFWVLADLGKTVLRPGGMALTRWLLSRAEVTWADVVELAPGLGRTTATILKEGPRSYVGVDRSERAVHAVNGLLRGFGEVRLAEADATGLPDASANVVLGEAVLTMQTDRVKRAIVAEAARVLVPGGRYAIHELALTPDDLPTEGMVEIRRSLARIVRVHARPLTLPQWRALLAAHGLVVEQVRTAPMALLEPQRLLADEGLRGALRFAWNLRQNGPARRRVLAMRRVFRTHRHHLTGVALIARKPDSTPPEAG